MAPFEKEQYESKEVEDGGLRQVPTVQALPDAVRAEAGVLLDVGDSNIGSLKLARDGHVS